MSNVIAELKTYLNDEFGLEDIQDSQALFSSRLLHSIDAVRVVHFLEQQFGVSFAGKKVGLKEIDSLQAMAALVVS